MDVYQKTLFRLNSISFFASKPMITGKYFFDNEAIVLKQDEDIKIVGYTLRISTRAIKSIFVIKGNKETLVNVSKDVDIAIDFNDPINAIRFVFENNYADDLVIPVVYQKASEKDYYEKQENTRRNLLQSNASVKYSTGADLVNIYFRPCCEEYKRTEIDLYKDNMMLAKYKVNEDVFFHTINGLAYGKYDFILKQFDIKGKLLIEMGKISFTLSMPNYGGKPTVYYS